MLESLSDMAEKMSLAAYVPGPDAEVTARIGAGLAARLPFLPPEAAWLQAFRTPVIMDTSKAKRRLGWRPSHDARQTLVQTVAAAREQQLLG